MSDLAVRLLVVAATATTSMLVAWWATTHASRRAERGPIDVSGFSGRVLLFTGEACSRCGAARDALVATGVTFVEVSYEEHPDGMREAGVASVPLIVVRDADDGIVGRIAGRPRAARLRRALAAAGVD